MQSLWIRNSAGGAHYGTPSRALPRGLVRAEDRLPQASSPSSAELWRGQLRWGIPSQYTKWLPTPRPKLAHRRQAAKPIALETYAEPVDTQQRWVGPLRYTKPCPAPRSSSSRGQAAAGLIALETYAAPWIRSSAGCVLYGTPRPSGWPWCAGRLGAKTPRSG